MNDLFSVRGKSVVVTGGAQGIGFGICRQFVDSGANVLVVDLSAQLAQKACEALSSGTPNAERGKAVPLAADVADEATPGKVISACASAFGGIDVLVNNAGIFPMTPMLKLEPAAFDQVWRVNMRGLAFLSKAAALRMIEQGRGGAIVNIGSIDSVHPSMVGLAAYDASKGAVLMFTRSLALELAPHRIRVNSVLPGGIETEGTAAPLKNSGMTEAQLKAMKEQFLKNRVPLGRMGLPADIAGAVQFLASNAASYVTGASLVVDGGALLA